MATHSRVLAWRIPGTVGPGGLPSMGLLRVGHDWSDLAAAAAAVTNCWMPSVDWCKSEKHLRGWEGCGLSQPLPIHFILGFYLQKPHLVLGWKTQKVCPWGCDKGGGKVKLFNTSRAFSIIKTNIQGETALPEPYLTWETAISQTPAPSSLPVSLKNKM